MAARALTLALGALVVAMAVASSAASGNNFNATAHADALRQFLAHGTPGTLRKHRRLLPDGRCFPGSQCTHRVEFADFEFCWDLDWEACPRAVFPLTAEANAKEVYDQLEPFLEDTSDCKNAARHYICASWFPRCTREELGLAWVTVRDVCYSTCVNYFKACGRNHGTACDGLIGDGPNNPVCTGGASTVATPWLLPSMALFVSAWLMAASVLG